MSSEFTKLLEIIISASLINNFVFTRFLGLCIFFGVSKKMETAVGMSITFTAVMMISAAISWVIFNMVLVPLEITFLEIIVFIGIIAGLVQVSDTIMRKVSPGLYYKLGIYLALISTNCIILAVPLISVGEKYSFIQTLAFATRLRSWLCTCTYHNGQYTRETRTGRCPGAIQGIADGLYHYGPDSTCVYRFFGLITL